MQQQPQQNQQFQQPQQYSQQYQQSAQVQIPEEPVSYKQAIRYGVISLVLFVAGLLACIVLPYGFMGTITGLFGFFFVFIGIVIMVYGIKWSSDENWMSSFRVKKNAFLRGYQNFAGKANAYFGAVFTILGMIIVMATVAFSTILPAFTGITEESTIGNKTTHVTYGGLENLDGGTIAVLCVIGLLLTAGLVFGCLAVVNAMRNGSRAIAACDARKAARQWQEQQAAYAMAMRQQMMQGMPMNATQPPPPMTQPSMAQQPVTPESYWQAQNAHMPVQQVADPFIDAEI